MPFLPMGPDLDGEQWKPVEGHELYYEVSNMGRVRMTPRIIGHSEYHGYLQTNMPGRFKGHGSSRGRKRETGFRVPVHRIVGEMFLVPVEGKTEINHKDGNKLNNCASNLEFCNRSENVQHAYDTGLRRRQTTKKLTDDDYREIRKLYFEGGYTHETLAVKFQVSCPHIGYVLNRSKRKV